ncbi:RNA-binding protein 15-like [Plectropomus leopardus]|uniref:RNA-binding protein 15-like n=1 Tax=Plectropomus leopardus TaxID=160734 RepID=UPI001C4D189F|nr:RNA-binding protein 15-like [Plectropomus leopardus]
MKGKERSPVKKRSRAPDDSRDRGGSKKTGALSAVGSNNGNGSAHGGASSRRSLNSEKRDMRDLDGHNASSRGGSGYDYAVVSGNKPYGGADMDAETSRSGSRSDPRPPSTPENEYKTLKISGLGNQLNDGEIEDGLFHEFKRFGDVSVKMSRENDERVAYVNFRRPDDARSAKHARGKLVLYDRPLKIETVYTNRLRSRSPVSKDNFSPGHRHLHSQRPLSPTGMGYRDYRLQQLALGRLPAPHPPPHIRDLERDRDFSVYDARTRPPFIPECAVFREEDTMTPEDDQRANRTLFLGNLDVSVTESDLRRAFDRFGAITEVDIKRAVRGQSNTYGFIKFENLDMAHRAKVAMSGKVVGHNPIKIGYGKPTPTTRLWVGGLGPWVPLAALAKEFDRFGTIRTIDYRKGEVWAYIQYESLDAAQAACTHMRGFPLGGPDRRLRVDFADTEHRYQHQQYVQLPLPLPHYDFVPEPFAHRLTDSVRVRERSPPVPARFRERDLYPSAEWSGVHDRVRGAGFEPIDRLERRPHDSWSLERERELQGRDLSRKRRHLDDGGRPDHSPESSDFGLHRHGSSLERSPGGSSRDGGRYSDSERLPRSGRASPVRERQNTGFGDKRRRTLSPAAPGFSSEKDRKQRTSDSSKSPAKKEDRFEPPCSSSSKSGQQSKPAAGGQKLSQVWQGVLLLKNSSFPTSLHMLEGDVEVANSLLLQGAVGSQASQLKISQRLRLDQPKLEEVSRRIKAAGSSGYSILLAVPGKSENGGTQDASSSAERPLKNLVSYLKQKEAAGIISLPVGGSRDKEHGGVLHAFPPCEFSQQFVDASAKAFAKSEDDYMVMVIIKGAS